MSLDGLGWVGVQIKLVGDPFFPSVPQNVRWCLTQASYFELGIETKQATSERKREEESQKQGLMRKSGVREDMKMEEVYKGKVES